MRGGRRTPLDLRDSNTAFGKATYFGSHCHPQSARDEFRAADFLPPRKIIAPGKQHTLHNPSANLDIVRSSFPTVATLGVSFNFSMRFNVSTRIPARRASSACESPAARRSRISFLATLARAWAIAS